VVIAQKGKLMLLKNSKCGRKPKKKIKKIKGGGGGPFFPQRKSTARERQPNKDSKRDGNTSGNFSCAACLWQCAGAGSTGISPGEMQYHRAPCQNNLLKATRTKRKQLAVA